MILVGFDSAFYCPFTQRHTRKRFFSWHGEIILPEFIVLGKSKHFAVGAGLEQADPVFR
jgi:hypothetical protein